MPSVNAKKNVPSETSKKPLQRRLLTSAGPINQQISVILRKRIATGGYDCSQPFPPEVELMEEFGCSRHTMRAAIQKLVVDGLLERRRGAGTAILQRVPNAGTWAIASLDNLVRDFYEAKLISANVVRAKNHPVAAKLFGVGAAGSLFRVVRILSSTKGPFSLSTIFTTVENGSSVPRDRITSKVFLSLLEEYCGVRATRAKQTATAAPASKIARDALGFGNEEAMLVLHRTFFNRSGEPLEYVEMLCRPSLYAQVVEFSRGDMNED
jgi:GntR family transcriptional regulator